MRCLERRALQRCLNLLDVQRPLHCWSHASASAKAPSRLSQIGACRQRRLEYEIGAGFDEIVDPLEHDTGRPRLGLPPWQATIRDLEAEIPYPLSRVVEDIHAALTARPFQQRLRDNLAKALDGRLQ